MLLPSYQARLVREDGTEVTDFDTPGELLVKSPNQAPGYLLAEEHKSGESSSSGGDTFLHDGWLRTGDVALFRRFIPSISTPSSNEENTNGSGKGEEKQEAHLSIVDRLRDMIKVKRPTGLPVAIEECLRAHPAVGDIAVVGVADELAGERPKAFLVLVKAPPSAASNDNEKKKSRE